MLYVKTVPSFCFKMTLNTLSSIPSRGVHTNAQDESANWEFGQPCSWKSPVVRSSDRGQNFFNPWPDWMCAFGQERGIVPTAPALLHIHTTREESNKRRLRGINCLTWEKQLIVRRHRQTMLRLWERGNFVILYVICSRLRTQRGWIYPCEHACRLISAWRRTFLHTEI